MDGGEGREEVVEVGVVGAVVGVITLLAYTDVV